MSFNEITGLLAHELRGRIDFAMFIKIARVAKGMSRLELAEKASINKSTLQNAESGKCLPKPRTLDKLAIALEFDSNQRAYCLSLWAEEQIKTGDNKQTMKKSQPRKRAALTSMTEKEKAAFEQITGKAW